MIVSNINNLKNKEFSLTFKQGQDFEFVKYAIAKEFEVFQEKIVKKIFYF